MTALPPWKNRGAPEKASRGLNRATFLSPLPSCASFPRLRKTFNVRSSRRESAELYSFSMSSIINSSTKKDEALLIVNYSIINVMWFDILLVCFLVSITYFLKGNFSIFY